MQISFLLPSLRLYGGIRRMLEIANRAIVAGHEVTIYHSDGSPCGWMEVQARVLPQSALVDRQHEHLVYIFPEQYSDAHRARSRRLYHYNLNLYNKTLLRIPTPVSFFLRRAFAVNRAYWIRMAVLDPRAKILVNCTDSAVWLKQHFGVDAIPVLGAVNQKIFHPAAVPKDPNAIKILYLGSPKYWKESDVVKRVFELVKKTFPNAVLESFYDKDIPQSKMAEVYGAADVFVDAQIYAGWNNPVAEAMACKVPVVCYDIGPNRDIAFHEQTALLVPPKRPDLMAQAIIRLLHDQQLRKQITERAYQAIKAFTWERTTKEFLTVLEHAQS